MRNGWKVLCATAKILEIWMKRGFSQPVSYLHQKLPALLGGIIVVYSLFFLLGGIRILLLYLLCLVLLGQGTGVSLNTVLSCDLLFNQTEAPIPSAPATALAAATPTSLNKTEQLCTTLQLLPVPWEGTTLQSWGISKTTFAELNQQATSLIVPLKKTGELVQYVSIYPLLMCFAAVTILVSTMMLWLSRERLGQRERHNYLSTLMLLGLTRGQARATMLLMRGLELLVIYLFSAILFRFTIVFADGLDLFGVPLQSSLFLQQPQSYLVVPLLLTAVTLGQNLYLFKQSGGQIFGGIGPQTEVHFPVAGNWSSFQSQAVTNPSVSGASFATWKWLFRMGQPGASRLQRWWRLLLFGSVFGGILFLLLLIIMDQLVNLPANTTTEFFGTVLVALIFTLVVWGSFYYIVPIILRIMLWPLRKIVSSPSLLVALRIMQQYQHQFWDAIAPTSIMMHLFLTYSLIIQMMNLDETPLYSGAIVASQTLLADMKMGINVSGVIVLFCCLGCLYNSLSMDLQSRWEENLSLLHQGWSKLQIIKIKVWRLLIPTLFSALFWLIWVGPSFGIRIENYQRLPDKHFLGLLLTLRDFASLIPGLGWLLLGSTGATALIMLVVEWLRLRRSETA